MEEYASYRRTQHRKPEINPIWRGIGCILMIVIPVASYIITVAILPSILATGWLPQGLLGRVQFSEGVYNAPTLGAIAQFLSGIDYFWVKLIVFFIVFSLLSGFLSFLYSLFYQWFGPPRYTEVDAPPSGYRPKGYKR